MCIRRPGGSAAACSGATELAKIPCRARSRRPRSCGGRSPRASASRARDARRRAVHDHVVGSARQRPVDRRSASRVPRATTASSASVASSIRARVERWATRSWYGDHDAGGHHAGRGPVDHHEVGPPGDGELGGDEVGVEPLGHRHDRRRRARPGRRSARAGCSIDAPAAAAVVDERDRERAARRRGGSGPGRAARRTARSPGRRRAAGRSRSWSGQRITTSCAPVASPASGAPTMG